MKRFRTLRADEIECRIALVKETGISLLLYKDARCDMNILDEEIGPENWQRHHIRENANCIVSIWDDKKTQWIDKEDTGTESFTEKEKGIASDSFKRACFNWGIGRELYTAPFIWVSKSDCNIKESGRADRNGKPVYICSDKFYVSDIGYNDNRCINRLQIKNVKTHRVVFELGKIESQEPESKLPEPATEAQKATIREISSKHKIDVDMLYTSNGITEETVTDEQAAKLLISLKAKFGDS